ncbi:hypothetical protein QMG61_17115, partial [Cryobacterium sp. PH31-AA6]|nr:hypothetical protein [Cryobacterium sp. PH31-AA6]
RGSAATGPVIKVVRDPVNKVLRHGVNKVMRQVVNKELRQHIPGAWTGATIKRYSSALLSLYPGFAYVDVVAIEGYNWGTAAAWSSWTTPSALFGIALGQLRTLAQGKPILTAETASAEPGGLKALWNTTLVPYLNALSDVTGFVGFDHNKKVDWRIASSCTSAASFATALAPWC